MLEELTKTLNPRLFVLLLVAIAVVIVTSGYSSLFKQQLKTYKSQQNRYEALNLLPTDPSKGKRTILALEKEISELDAELTKAGLEVIKSTKPMRVIADLGRTALLHDVQLVNIAPGPSSSGDTYTEVPFQVEMSGSYGQLFKWVYAVEHAGTPLFVKQFSMRAGTNEQQRELRLSLALIQPLEEQ